LPAASIGRRYATPLISSVSHGNAMSTLGSEQLEKTAAVEQPWFRAKPIPVFVIAAWSSIYVLGVSIFLFKKWPAMLQLVNEGSLSGFVLAYAIFYPLLFLSAGMALLLMRKVALYLFAAWFLIGIVHLFRSSVAQTNPVDLALAFGIIIYCLRLRSEGRLS